MTEDEAADGGRPTEDTEVGSTAEDVAADSDPAGDAADSDKAGGAADSDPATDAAESEKTGDAADSSQVGESAVDADPVEGATEGGQAAAPDRDDVPIPSSSPASPLPPDRRVEAPIGAVERASATPRGSDSDVPADVQKYDRFKKVDGAQYERVNEFLRERTYLTAREWAIARLCSDFRTETGIEMTKIGENLPHLVPFMTDTYTPQAVNQARSSFEKKVRKSGSTFLYGAMSDFFTADELDDLMYEVTEVAKFLLEVEGVDLSVEEELEGEEMISSVMREVRSASDELRHEGTTCPNCGHEMGSGE